MILSRHNYSIFSQFWQYRNVCGILKINSNIITHPVLDKNCVNRPTYLWVVKKSREGSLCVENIVQFKNAKEEMTINEKASQSK